MIAMRIAGLVNQILAIWKLCLSFRKRDWTFEDYPITVRETTAPGPELVTSRFKQHRYFASIVNWTLTGFGDTKKEALSDLTAHFETAKASRAQKGVGLPRPGNRVQLEFASQARTDAHAALAKDVTRRVLEVPWAFLSDESSLWDFHFDETNDAVYAKIKEVYGVDVSDIASANLSEILERIASSGHLSELS